MVDWSRVIFYIAATTIISVSVTKIIITSRFIQYYITTGQWNTPDYNKKKVILFRHVMIAVFFIAWFLGNIIMNYA